MKSWQKVYLIILLAGIFILGSASILYAETTAENGYRYLRLTALDGVNPNYIVYVTEINWLVGADAHPFTRTNSSSTNVSATAGGSSAWRAYDGAAELPSWNAQTTTFPYSITLDLGAGQGIVPTGIQIAAQWQERTLSSFVCEGSSDGTTWTTLFSQSGLTSSDWIRNEFKTFEFPEVPAEDPENLITNGEFSNGTSSWTPVFQADAADGGNFEVVADAGMSGSNAAKININNGGTANWNVELFSLFNLELGKTYEISFKAKAAANRSALVIFQKGSDPYTHYWEQSVNLTSVTQDFGPYTWTSDTGDEAARLNFKMGGNNADIWIDAVVVKEVSSTEDTVINYPNENSMLGMNLSSPRAWSDEFYFTNLAHHSLAWMPVGTAPDFSNRIPSSELTPGKYLKPGASGRLVVFWDLDPANLASGNYVFTYEGTANVTLSEYSSSGISLVSSTAGRIEINVPTLSTQIFLYFDVTNNSTSNPIRNIRFTALDREHSTDIFRPEFISEYETLKAYRFMDWMHTNNSTVSGWEDYPADNALIQTSGVSFNYMIALANQTKSDAWFCVPMLADDHFVRQMAIKIRDNLDPDVRAYIELSNEVWNGQFDANSQAADKAVEVGIAGSDNKPWEDAARYVGYRTARIEQIFEEEFNKVSTKPDLTVLIAWQAANAWQMENRALPQYRSVMGSSAVPEAVAIAPYFGNALGSQSTQSIVETWTVDMLFDQLFNNTYEDQVGDATIERAINYMRNYKALVDEYEIPKLLAYEGGQHLVGTGSAYNNITLRNLLQEANRDRQMFDAYIAYFDAWKEIGGDLFATFASTASYGRSGSWGWKEQPSQTRAEAPKYDAILTWNSNNPAGSAASSMVSLSNQKKNLLSSSKREILIYPNPAENGFITIKFDKPTGNRVTIHNINGSVYLNETVDQEVKTINLEKFRSGIYFIRINGISQKVIVP